MDKIYEEVAHDAEILCLSYSKEVDGIIIIKAITFLMIFMWT